MGEIQAIVLRDTEKRLLHSAKNPRTQRQKMLARLKMEAEAQPPPAIVSPRGRLAHGNTVPELRKGGGLGLEGLQGAVQEQ